MVFALEQRLRLSSEFGAVQNATVPLRFNRKARSVLRGGLFHT